MHIILCTSARSLHGKSFEYNRYGYRMYHTAHCPLSNSTQPRRQPCRCSPAALPRSALAAPFCGSGALLVLNATSPVDVSRNETLLNDTNITIFTLYTITAEPYTQAQHREVASGTAQCRLLP